MRDHPWMAGHRLSGMPSRWRSQEVPRFKHISEIGERIELGYGSGGRGVREHISDSVDTLDNPIFSRWHQDGAVGVPKFNCVRNNLALGIHLYEFEGTV